MTRKKPRTPGWHLSLCSVIPSGARSIIVLLLAFGWSNVGPRAQFSNHVTHVGLGPMSHAVGDFDRDGQDDLVTANRDSSDLSVVLGNGNGTFGPETRYPLGGSPGFLVLEDFDGDGFDDVVVTIPSIDGISVLLGLGDGRFTEPSRYPAGEAPFGIAVADFDRDGDQDLVVTSDDTDQVSLLYGRGDGTFDLGPTYGAGDGPRGVVVADFNQDGVPDAAVANYWSEDVSVLLGTTDGGLGPETRYALVDNPHAIAVVDVDEDGIQDVAASDNQEVSVLIGAGDGTFGRAITVTEQRDVLLALAACDLDQDGHADLVGAGYNASVFRGNGDGTFQDEVAFPRFRGQLIEHV